MLVSTLPGQNGALRVRFWRTLKSLGAATVRDGVYALPAGQESRDAFEALRSDIVQSNGTAYVVSAATQPDREEDAFRSLFDRSEQYDEVVAKAEALGASLGETTEAEARRTLRQLVSEFEAASAIDFFRSSGQERARAILGSLTNAVTRNYSPDEPSAQATAIEQRERDMFRRRVWATRRKIWVDRVASAWLIKRFIDPDATFKWLEDPKECPSGAVGFDFDGATFTHVGDACTFEVLIASFGLADDGRLARIATIVHSLDVGGITVPEAAGFEAMLEGTRERSRDDDEILARTSDVLDSLYEAFR